MLSSQLDRKVRWRYYRPFIWAGFWVVVAGCITGGSMLYTDWLKTREWGRAPFQSSEATCVNSTQLVSRVEPGWTNTFRIGGDELTSVDRDGCIAGRHYELTYRIGRTGRLKVQSGKRL